MLLIHQKPQLPTACLFRTVLSRRYQQSRGEVNPIRRHECPYRVHSVSDEEGTATTATIPTRKPNTWASLGAARRPQSLLRQSNTRQSIFLVLAIYTFPDAISEISSRYQRARAEKRACERETISWHASWPHSANALAIASRPDTMRLFSGNEENVTWDTGLRQVLRRVRHALRRSQYARARVILQNDRRDEKEVSVDGVLLAPGGSRCRPGEYCGTVMFRESHEFQAVSNAPVSAPETRVRTRTRIYMLSNQIRGKTLRYIEELNWKHGLA